METHKKKKKKKERKKERKQAVLDAVKFNRINLTLPPIPSPTSCRDRGLTWRLGLLMSQAQAPHLHGEEKAPFSFEDGGCPSRSDPEGVLET